MNSTQQLSDTQMQTAFKSANKAKTALDLSVKSWFVIALTGQWAFAVYILLVYVVSQFVGIELGDIVPAQSFKKADGMDLALAFLHVIPAVYLSLLGCTQLVPAMRNKYRAFHRWNGRIFFTLGISGALTGLYLQWGAGFRLSDIGSLGITLNGILIPIAIFLAWKHAINKRFDLHMRWAVHSFLLVNAVWTFRLYLMGWYMVNQGPNGNNSTLDGPADIMLTFACYLLPMALAELYFWSKKQKHSTPIWWATSVMFVGALITLIGGVSAGLMMWAPRISMVLQAL